MKITWVGHACFKIETDNHILVLDPYKEGTVPGLDPVNMEADRVICSHKHGDHFGMEEIHIRPQQEDAFPSQVETIHTFHDKFHGLRRGKNNITIISDGTYKIAHLGDLGCSLTPDQSDRLKDLDVLMIPVGGYYTINGKEAADIVNLLQPKVVIPMHYRNDKLGFGFSEIGTVDDFTEHMNGVTVLGDNLLNLEHMPQAKVIVMTPLRSHSAG